MCRLMVNVWVRNPKGEFLVVQRSGKLLEHPLLWECVSGVLKKGEISVECALREAEEKLGIYLKKSNGKLIFSQVRNVADEQEDNEIHDIWLFEYDGEIPLEEAESSEVAYAAWMNWEQIRRLQEHHCLTENLEYFLENIDGFLEENNEVIIRKSSVEKKADIFEKWEDVKWEVKASLEMTTVSFNVWMKPLKLAEVRGNVLRVFCEVSDAVEYIEVKYKKALEKAVEKVVGESYIVEIFS